MPKTKQNKTKNMKVKYYLFNKRSKGWFSGGG
jgi:hypothetical protein